jgi:hypothetical protein
MPSEGQLFLRPIGGAGDGGGRDAGEYHQPGVVLDLWRVASRRPLRGEQGGIVSLTRAMATELAPFHIRVSAIAPGLTDTAQPRYGATEAELTERAAAMPLGRMGQPEDIANVAVFLASENPPS